MESIGPKMHLKFVWADAKACWMGKMPDGRPATPIAAGSIRDWFSARRAATPTTTHSIDTLQDSGEALSKKIRVINEAKLNPLQQAALAKKIHDRKAEDTIGVYGHLLPRALDRWIFFRSFPSSLEGWCSPPGTSDHPSLFQLGSFSPQSQPAVRFRLSQTARRARRRSL